MRNARGRTLVIALLALGTAACHSGAWSADGVGNPLPDVSAEANLVVRNESGGAVNVSVAREFRSEARLGLVPADSTKTFLLESNLWDSSPVAVVATPVSGFGEARSAPFDVFDGSTITFTVTPDLRRSYATVR